MEIPESPRPRAALERENARRAPPRGGTSGGNPIGKSGGGGRYASGHFPVAAGCGDVAEVLVPPVASTAPSLARFWPTAPGTPAGGGATGGANGPGSPAGGGGGGSGFAGSGAGPISGRAGRASGAGSIRDGSSWSGRGMTILSPGVRRSMAGTLALLAAQRALAKRLRLVVLLRDRPEVLADADRVGERDRAEIPRRVRTRQQAAAEGLIGVHDGSQLLRLGLDQLHPPVKEGVLGRQHVEVTIDADILEKEVGDIDRFFERPQLLLLDLDAGGVISPPGIGG